MAKYPTARGRKRNLIVSAGFVRRARGQAFYRTSYLSIFWCQSSCFFLAGAILAAPNCSDIVPLNMCVRYKVRNKWKRGHNAKIFEGIARSFRDISQSRSPQCERRQAKTKTTPTGGSRPHGLWRQRRHWPPPCCAGLGNKRGGGGQWGGRCGARPSQGTS